MKLNTDFTLLLVSIELDTLREHLELIEQQAKWAQNDAESRFQADMEKLPSFDEAEWGMLRQEYNYRVDFVIPRVLRNPFLVSLFAVYETTVLEIAGLIQKKQNVRIPLNDLKGDLLERAKKYYSEILQFELSKSNVSWERLALLSDLRNVIAHTNGRIDTIADSKRERLLKSKGVYDWLDFVLVDEAFLKETYALVKDEIEALMERYKAWDSARGKLGMIQD